MSYDMIVGNAVRYLWDNRNSPSTAAMMITMVLTEEE
jgi:hypothetical protein